MKYNAPEAKIREVLDACADCGSCRDFMETCLVFPELYRLYDKEQETGSAITSRELRQLTDLCNFCALCPCHDIRAKIIQAKTEFINRDGLPLNIRFLENPDQLGRICGIFPRVLNRIFQTPLTAQPLKKIMGIHEKRNIPVIPEKDFPSQVKKQGLFAVKKGKHKKAALFAGCTGRYFFPDVPKAAIDVLEYNNIEVYYPKQKCCGMPAMLEGDQQTALSDAEFNIDYLFQAVEAGYDIICSCPTCGYMLKKVLKEGAYYSDQYQKWVQADETHIKLPLFSAANSKTDSKTDSQENQFQMLSKSIYKNLLKDNGIFSALDPLKRISVADHTFDLGEYLLNLYNKNEMNMDFGHLPIQGAYYPPCHMREQNMGRPYQELMNKIPEIKIKPVESTFYCCGIAGIMGFKKDFYQASLDMGTPLMEKIKEINPEKLITDCLSCRIQFQHMLCYEVVHPIEIIKESYNRFSCMKNS
ncbi:Cysteine-rich domain-containing protein [Desulfonema limicola]|uniref:Cysteine-rich domain-containing protein n=1 Tax=Desulfonema limicola TaxID=45656 RepID=A0A975B6D3_9BACT|nr:heterodisulfide reductase-related iron-sulfur binding cluster [Desulfonema limicola]QTA79660.1 Cysteine-rich domain-containing protein [Desulfonema limicola]